MRDDEAGAYLEDAVLDTYFVSSAKISEPSAAQRSERALSQASAVGQHAHDRVRWQPGPVRPVRTTRRWILISGVVAVVMLIAFADPGAKLAAAWTLRDPLQLLVVDGSRPTPQRAVSSVPLGTPQPTPPNPGTYTFAALQPGSTVPVTYDPCRPLAYVVNNRSAPPGGDVLVQTAIRGIEDVTGLRFSLEGTTDEVPTADRDAFQRERYGDRWAPILIAWSDPAEVAGLGGDVAGTGGSMAVTTPGRPDVYVTGMIQLDGPQLADIIAHSSSAHAEAVIVHELAHVVGLHHVADPRQLMHASGHHTQLQSGDIAGLVRLGAGPCLSYL